MKRQILKRSDAMLDLTNQTPLSMEALTRLFDVKLKDKKCPVVP